MYVYAYILYSFSLRMAFAVVCRYNQTAQLISKTGLVCPNSRAEILSYIACPCSQRYTLLYIYIKVTTETLIFKH